MISLYKDPKKYSKLISGVFLYNIMAVWQYYWHVCLSQNNLVLRPICWVFVCEGHYMLYNFIWIVGWSYLSFVPSPSEINANLRERESLTDIGWKHRPRKRETKRSIKLMSEFLALLDKKLLYKYKLNAIFKWHLQYSIKHKYWMPIIYKVCTGNRTTLSTIHE